MFKSKSVFFSNGFQNVNCIFIVKPLCVYPILDLEATPELYHVEALKHRPVLILLCPLLLDA